MNTFVENFDAESNTTYTDNGCKTFSSSLNKNVDMFGMMSAMRGRYEDDILEMFKGAYEEDKVLAIKNLFYLRDIRGGQGERSTFRICCRFLCESEMTNDEFYKFVSYIPEYGRWDDVLDVLEYLNSTEGKISVKNLKERIEAILDVIKAQLETDIEAMNTNGSVSLLAKWFPLANNTNNSKKKLFAKMLANTFFDDERECRKTIVALRKYLNILEQKISSNEWDSIDYSKIPSKAGMKYVHAFSRHDAERYSEFLESVKKGETAINTGTLYPYELVHKVMKSYDKNEIESYNVMWDNLPDYTNGNSAICVVDVSGSMSCGCSNIRPIDVALSLGIYFAERNEGAFKNRFFTFSEVPQCVALKGNTLDGKISNMSRAEWDMNTDIKALFDLYIKLAKKSDTNDLPKSIIIISDMEFDEITTGYYKTSNASAFEYAKNRFEEENIPMPTLCFWNVNSSGHNVPVKYDESGTVLVSGASPVIFKMVMEGKTPVDFMLSVLNQDRYNVNIF